MTGARSKFFWPVAVAITLIAFFLRFYHLADHPLGLFFDPAINGLDSLRLIQRGGFTLFFPTNGGREALFMYLLVPFIQLFGPVPLSLRLVTATVSLLNVVFLLAFLYDLRFTAIPGWSRHYRLWFAALGSLVLATMYWHIAISRLGQRPILVPMLSVPLFWFFLKAWQSGQKRWFILSGLLMGLGGYTYPAVRLLPVILSLALLPEFFLKPTPPQVQVGSLRQSEPHAPRTTYYAPHTTHHALRFTFYVLPRLLLFGLAALLIYLPMAGYLLTHPALFGARALSVTVWHFLDTPADIAAELGRNLLRVAGFFCCQGSPNPIFGLPYYPGLSPLLTPFLLIGLGVALKQWRDFFHRLVALWWLIGLTPSIIAIEAPHPLRLIVALPPTAILVTLGIWDFGFWILDFRFHASHATCHTPPTTHHAPPTTYHLSRLMHHVSPITLYFLLFAFYVLLPLPSLFTAYFSRWPQLTVTQGIYDYGAVAVRDAALMRAAEDQPIYLPLSRYNDSTLLYYLGQAFPRQAKLTAPPAGPVLLISPEKYITDTTWVRLYQHTATVLPPLTAEGQHLIQSAFTQEAAPPIRTGRGEIVARVASLAEDPVRFVETLQHPLEASFGPVRLVGATYSQEISGTVELPVTLFWQANAPTKDEYEVLLRLVDDRRQAYGNGDGRPTDWVYPTSFWRPGQDTIAARQVIRLETAALPSGRYWLAVSVFDPALGQLLPLTAGASDAPDTFFIGPLKISLPAPYPELVQSFTPQEVQFGEAIRLAGIAIPQPAVAAGEIITLDLLWHPLATPKLDYTIFVHLLDANGNLVAGNDTQPLAGRYPTSLWAAGETIPDRHSLPLPPDLPPGSYQLAIGLYHHPTGERLPLQLPNTPSDPAGRLILEPEIMVSAKR
jgi:hypothetical protein